MDNVLLAVSSIITILLINKLTTKSQKGGNTTHKDDVLYDKSCIEKCETIPIKRCPYEACIGNCKKTNCVSRCSNQNKKPILKCEDECQELNTFKTTCA